MSRKRLYLCQYTNQNYCTGSYVRSLLRVNNRAKYRNLLFVSRIRPSDLFRFTTMDPFRHFGRTPGQESTRRKASTYKGQYNTEKYGLKSMPRPSFEPMIPEFDPSKTIRPFRPRCHWDWQNIAIWTSCNWVISRQIMDLKYINNDCLFLVLSNSKLSQESDCRSAGRLRIQTQSQLNDESQ